MRPTIPRAVAVATLTLLLPSVAHAADAPCADAPADGYGYCFDDDPVGGAGASAYSEWLRVRGTSPRVLLIRPRTSFVPEMLVSVQRL